MDQLRFDVTRCFSQGREQQSGVKAMSNLCTRELKFCDDDDDDGKSRCSNKQQNYNTIMNKWQLRVWNVCLECSVLSGNMTHALTQWLIYSEVHPSPWVFKLFAWDSPRVSHIPAGSEKKGTKLPPEFLGTYELLKILWVGPHRINVCSWILEPLKKRIKNKLKTNPQDCGGGVFFSFFFFHFFFLK
jgi:hypothetical protein